MSGAGPRHLNLGGFPLLSTRSAPLIAHLARRLERGRQTVLLFANTNFFVQCAALRAQLRKPGVRLVNDGIGLAIAARLIKGHRFAENLNGTDFLPPLLAQLDAPAFLIGGRPGIADRAAATLARTHQVRVVGTRDGYGGLDDPGAVIRAIDDSGAAVVVVALGNPLQERWILAHRPQLGPRLVIGAGALLDFLAGEVVRAPPWVRALRLEWLFRLAQEPRRLLRRYTLDILTFLRLCRE
ncbi:MAG: WecB/TagA/CpsF family glycosyltransferase [Zoogloeaceae bacterium]|nr:WecB/TagA/CpsF family glycosyltransferase [Zoogloeaceae bacterium]